IEGGGGWQGNDGGGIEAGEIRIGTGGVAIVNAANAHAAAPPYEVVRDLYAAKRRESDADERQEGAELGEKELRYQSADDDDGCDGEEQQPGPRRALEAREIAQADGGGVDAGNGRAEIRRADKQQRHDRVGGATHGAQPLGRIGGL